MSDEKMREDFEEWECNANEGPLTDPIWLMRDACSPENYGIVQVQHNWEVWQASRAAWRVELPRAVAYEGVFDSLRHSEFVPTIQDVDSADEIYSLCRTIEVREAIEAAGIKVQS